MSDELKGRAKGGRARAEQLTPEKRKEISKKALAAKKEKSTLPRATHGKDDHPLRIGNVDIPCYVLADGKRVLAQRGVFSALDMSGSGGILTRFISGKALEPFISSNLRDMINSPILFITPGGSVANGYEAQILADICEAVLNARQEGKLVSQQLHIALQCEILMRGFSRVGIIALIDEATGYQEDRAKDALAKILEAFIAKELQPWVSTFPTEYYRELFRLRGLDFKKDSVRRPQYFGILTNDIVYKRLAPGVLEELNRVSPRNNVGHLKVKLFQNLTKNTGYPKLLGHLGKAIMLMQLSEDYQDFKQKLEKFLPVQTQQMLLPLDQTNVDEDDGRGI